MSKWEAAWHVVLFRGMSFSIVKNTRVPGDEWKRRRESDCKICEKKKGEVCKKCTIKNVETKEKQKYT